MNRQTKAVSTLQGWKPGAYYPGDSVLWDGVVYRLAYKDKFASSNIASEIANGIWEVSASGGGDANAANQLIQIEVAEYAAGITTVVPATDSTQAVGTDWTTLASFACRSIKLYNLTGTTLSYRRNGAGVTIVIPDGNAWPIEGITNAAQIDIQRADLSNTIVAFTYEQYA